MHSALEHPEPGQRPNALPRVEAALAGLRDVAVELRDPPQDLWARIERSLHDEPVDEPHGAGGLVEYRIDADDELVATGEGWNEFATANEAPELTTDQTGRCLWDVMSDGPLRELWQAAVDGVRTSGRAATVPFRCDGPEARRWFEMTLTPSPCGAVDFSSRLVFEMRRPEITELRRSASPAPGHGAAAVEVCCWCAAARDGATWRPVEEVLASSRALEAAPPVVAHGFCERCAVVARGELLAVG